MQPQVRNLQDLIKTQQDALQPQYSLIDQSIAANDTSGTAQVAGLEAKKTQAFGDITQAANDRGGYFSGYTPHEQATYTAGTYLPALAQLQSTIAQTRMGLLGKKADLGTKAFDTAYASQENDRQILADWEKMTAEQQFNASEADKTRVFTAQQNAADRATTLAGKQPDIPAAQFVSQEFFGYDPKNSDHQGLAEDIMYQLMTQYKMSEKAAAGLVYPYRKQQFGQ